MNDLDQGPLELEVSDFGPIVEAKIDLRPLTVFVGPSNTGKSYLAILIYALHRYFSGGVGLDAGVFQSSSRMFRRAGNEKLPKKTINEFTELAKQMLQDKGRSPFEEGHCSSWFRSTESFVLDLVEQGDYTSVMKSVDASALKRLER